MALPRPGVVPRLACERFRVNDRVRLSHLGRERFGHRYRYGPEAQGTVRGFGRESSVVRIQRDGIKSVVSYHEADWEPVPPQTE